MEIFLCIGVHKEQIMQKVVCITQEDNTYQYQVYVLVMHQPGSETLF